MNALIPTCLPNSLVVESMNPEQSTIRMSGLISRIRRASSTPFMCGMDMSVTTRSN